MSHTILSAENDLPMSRDGIFVVTGATWDSNGSHTVRVVEMIGERPGFSESWDAKRRRRARDTARRIDPRARWTRLNSERYENGQTAWTFTVSRLSPQYR